MDSTPSSTHHLHNNLMVSPPEAAPYDSFHSPALSATRYSSSEPTMGINQHASKMDISPRACGPPKNMASLLSPPLSPLNPPVPATPEPAVGMADPTLYPESNSPALAPQQPLFNMAEQFADLISKRTPSAIQDPNLKPTVQEYSVFVSAAFELYRRNPARWFEREKKYMSNVPTQWASLNKVQKVSTSTSSSIGRTLAPARKQMPSAPSPSKVQRQPRTPKATPKFQGGYEALVRAQNNGSISPNSAAVRTRQPATREDTDFHAIPDYSPSITTLNEHSKFRVEWKGTPLDLTNDPHRNLLHPAEILLASVLRLSCASYLTSKRRIFHEKITRARQGMEFRKTDSQKACKIDVNKASKLWSAFEKMGWFDKMFIAPHM